MRSGRHGRRPRGRSVFESQTEVKSNAFMYMRRWGGGWRKANLDEDYRRGDGMGGYQFTAHVPPLAHRSLFLICSFVFGIYIYIYYTLSFAFLAFLIK